MKKWLAHFYLLTVLTFSVSTLLAQTRPINAFTGTWKIDGAISTFNPGPAPRSQTITFAPDGNFTLEGTDGEGKTFGWSHPWSGGAEASIRVVKNEITTVVIRGNTLGGTSRSERRIVETIHAVVAKSGRTLTATLTATDDQARQVRHDAAFEKK